MSNDDLIFTLICGSVVLVVACLGFQTVKKGATSAAYEKKKELVANHLDRSHNSKGGFFNRQTEQIDSPIGDQIAHIDPIHLKKLGNSLCKADESCAQLLDLAHAMQHLQDLSGSILLKGMAPALTLAIMYRLISGGDRGLGPNSSLNNTGMKGEQHNARVYLRDDHQESRSPIKTQLEQEILNRMKNNSPHNQLLMKEEMLRAITKSGISDKRWVQVLLAALNWEKFKISSPFTVFGFLDRASLTQSEKKLAKWLVKKADLLLDKKHNPLFDAYKGKGLKAKKTLFSYIIRLFS